MAVDHIRYDILTQEALRGLVRTVLSDVAKNGLPGEHHFYISFDTTAEGVRLSARMRSQYPEEMTVVLQHQFWDLAVTEDGFEVGLSFAGIPEKLTVPFAAIKGFFDPSVQFGLKFEEIGESEAREGRDERPTARVPAEHKHPPPTVAASPVPANAEPPTSDPPADADKPAPSAEVVRLDRFRKRTE